jgi:hypothetical protein
MPRVLAPGATIRVVLESDQSEPVESRPTFLFRALSAREWMAVAEAAEADKKQTHIAMVLKLERIALIGWENMNRDGQPIPFSLEDLDAIVDIGEAIELFEKFVNATKLSPADKKKLELSPTSGPASSAVAAPPAGV